LEFIADLEGKMMLRPDTPHSDEAREWIIYKYQDRAMRPESSTHMDFSLFL
jgi:hypothetical protein